MKSRITEETIKNIEDKKCSWCRLGHHERCAEWIAMEKTKRLVRCGCYCRDRYQPLDRFFELPIATESLSDLLHAPRYEPLPSLGDRLERDSRQS